MEFLKTQHLFSRNRRPLLSVFVQIDMPYSTTKIAEAPSKSRKALYVNDMASSVSEADRTIYKPTSDVVPAEYWEGEA